jgi:hypothetical protein
MGFSPGVGATGLSSLTTATAVRGLPLLAVFVYVADEYPSAIAGTGALQAGVVGLYGVVILVVGVYPRCVHSL